MKRRRHDPIETRVVYSLDFFGSDMIGEHGSSLAELIALLGKRIEDCPTRTELKPDREYRVTVGFKELELRGRA